MNKRYFITTTLPYANSTPHVGHCLEFVQADALARYLRQENSVDFNIGLDEHGLKIYQAAQALSQDTQSFVDGISVKWKDFCQLFQISYSNFYRTTDLEHHVKVQRYWLKLVKTGDLYKKDYAGKYCVGCEEFKTESVLENNKCPLHPTTDLQIIVEQNWFFKLSKYRNKILKYVEDNSSFLKPASKKNELLNLIRDAEDISVSRLSDNLPWGVKVPNDPTQTTYVWFEALLNYLFAAGVENWNSDKVTKVQLCGPDNLKFQALIWQGILLANDNRFTDVLLVHGTILDANGNKMSKSVGNVIDPVEEVSKYGIDAVRYYILKGLNTYSNSNWNSSDLVEIYNTDLCNNFGNLLTRTLHLIEQNNVTLIEPLKEFKTETDAKRDSSLHYWSKFEFSTAIEKTNELVTFGNKYINDEKPWSNPDKRDTVLSNLYYLLKQTAVLYSPVVPDKASQVLQALEDRKKVILFNRIK